MNTPKELRLADEHVAAHPDGSRAETRREVPVDSPNLRSLDPWAVDVGRVDKPWGYELIWALTDVYCGKLLFVRAGHSLSLQFHAEKDESWFVQSGRARIELGEVGKAVLAEEVVGPGRRSATSRGRCTASPPLEDTTILEVSTPQLDDVIRLEDRLRSADPPDA